MFTSAARGFVFAAVVCGGILAACDDSPKSAELPASATVKKTAPKVAGLAPEMVAAVSAGKTAMILGVHFALRASPVVNKALPIDIVLVPHADFTALRAHFESRDGLVLVSGEVLDPVADVSAEKALEHQLVLMPSSEGMYMVTAIVETEGDEGTVTRIFSIPVVVAAAGPASAVAQQTPLPAKDGAAPATK